MSCCPLYVIGPGGEQLACGLITRPSRLEVEPTLAVLGAQAEQLRHLTFTPAGDIRPSFPAGTGLSNAWNCFSGMLQLTCLSLCGHKYLGNAGELLLLPIQWEPVPAWPITAAVACTPPADTHCQWR